jgi:hypothetical protein
MRALWRAVQVGALMLHVSGARGETEPATEAAVPTAPATAPPPATPTELPDTAPSTPPAEPAEAPPSPDLLYPVEKPAPPAEPSRPASEEEAPQPALGPTTPAGARSETSTPSPPDTSNGEWGARRSKILRWHSRYGVTLPLNPVGSGTRFYTDAQRVGMWTNFEYRILPDEPGRDWYLGVALQVEYEFDKHSPYDSGVKTELMIWEVLLRLNAGYQFDFDTRGLLLYVHAAGGGQRLRGRAWSPGEPVIQAVQHGFVGQTGVGSIFSFFHNRLELVLEGGVEESAEVSLQAGDRARAFVLPPLDPSSYYLRMGFGLAF